MTEQEYMQARVDDQIQWFNKKSGWNQKRFKLIRIANIIMSVCIPFETTLMDYANKDVMKITIGFTGALIAITEAVLSLYKYQENWIRYRANAENLQYQKFAFETRTGIYADETTAFANLVNNVEALLSKENNNWFGINQPAKKEQ